MDMQQFKVCYLPGGMGLDHSSWWVCARTLLNGVYVDVRIQYLRRSDYS
jgi:hypothetical protein